MSTEQPLEITGSAVETGTKKAHLRWDKGAGRGVPGRGLHRLRQPGRHHRLRGAGPAEVGTLPTLFMGAAFTLGLVLIAGSHLLIGNMMLVPISAMQGRLTLGESSATSPWCWSLGNLVGAVVFVSTSYWYLFLRDEPADGPGPR